jgi:Ca2+:H+ antiporter
MDLSVGIALGSCIQIALFVAPVLVLAISSPRSRSNCLSIARRFLGVLIGAMVSGDGQSNWYKGVQLVTVYAIIALMFYFMPVAS